MHGARSGSGPEHRVSSSGRRGTAISGSSGTRMATLSRGRGKLPGWQQWQLEPNGRGIGAVRDRRRSQDPLGHTSRPWPPQGDRGAAEAQTADSGDPVSQGVLAETKFQPARTDSPAQSDREISRRSRCAAASELYVELITRVAVVPASGDMICFPRLHSSDRPFGTVTATRGDTVDRSNPSQPGARYLRVSEAHTESFARW